MNAISLKQCSFTWKGLGDSSPTLDEIDIEVKHGDLVAIVGVVGSGKSSLISALLGDMCKIKGHALVDVSVRIILFARC